MTLDPKIQALLIQVLDGQRRGDIAGAEAACLQALDLDSRQPDALQFLGLIEETKGNLEAAETLMRQSLTVNPAQPHVLNNLGNLLHKTGRSTEALDALRKAIQMHPGYGEAWYNLGKIQLDLENFKEATKALEKAIKNWSHSDPKPQTLMGDIYKQEEKYDQALVCFKEALQINPKYFNALHNYGLTLKQMQRPKEAIEIFLEARDVNPDVPELYYNMGNAYYELDDMDNAFANYHKALELKPDFLEAHTTLNELYWRYGHKDKYLQSYADAIKKKPALRELRHQYADSLLLEGKFDKAAAVVDGLFQTSQPGAKAFQLRAKVMVKQGDIYKSLEDLEKCIELEPQEIEYRKDITKFLIKMGKYNQALAQMEAARKIAPLNQEVLAYLGLCWRLLGDEKEKYLNNYDQFVRGYTIETPEGYGDLAEFNRALNQALDPFHTTKMQPSDQTLRGGTQTIAALLDRNVREIQDLKKSFEKTIRRYISDLPDDPEHPYLSRKSSKFTFSGSWSIRLKDQGFHVNHVHPEGWISSSYYVSLPDEVKSGVGQQGWIKFGESPLKMGTSEVIRKIVRPEVGLLVLFPSYMFHGTMPFTSKQPRTTLPFDVVPLPE